MPFTMTTGLLPTYKSYQTKKMSKHIKYKKKTPVFPFVDSENFVTCFYIICWYFFTFHLSIHVQDKYLTSTEQELIFAI